MFSYYHCHNCRLQFLFPIPKDLKNYYPEEYYVIPSSIEEFLCGLHTEKYKIDHLKRLILKGRLLDIGPATGGFLYLAKQAGFAVQGIEMDRRCCQFLKEKLDIPVIHSDDTIKALKEVPLCDAITLWHVIEHLPAPWEALEAITERLVPGGFLILAAPNPRALQFQLLRRFWAHVDAPRHLALIPIETLTEWMQKLGLKLHVWTTADEGAINYNRFGWQRSLTNFTNASWMKKCLNISGRVVCELLRSKEIKEGLGSTYTVIFQKEVTK